MNTYTTPTVVARGSVVHTTLTSKSAIAFEDDVNNKRPLGGSNLSFGL